MNISWISIPIISALIGWFTNWIAIKMLFHPRKPTYIFGYNVQGVFPKRQDAFAKKMSSMVSKQLLSFDDIQKTLINPEAFNNLKPVISEKVDQMIETKMADYLPMVSMFLGKDKLQKIKNSITDELIIQLPIIMNSFTNQAKEKLDIEGIVYEKVRKLDVLELEQLLTSILNKEFKFIELLGAVIGFLIGLIQILMIKFL